MYGAPRIKLSLVDESIVVAVIPMPTLGPLTVNCMSENSARNLMSLHLKRQRPPSSTVPLHITPAFHDKTADEWGSAPVMRISFTISILHGNRICTYPSSTCLTLKLLLHAPVSNWNDSTSNVKVLFVIFLSSNITRWFNAKANWHFSTGTIGLSKCGSRVAISHSSARSMISLVFFCEKLSVRSILVSVWCYPWQPVADLAGHTKFD